MTTHEGRVSAYRYEMMVRLDQYTERALNWPASTDPWDEESAEVEKAKAVSAGRGIAIALAAAFPSRGDADQQIRESVARVRALGPGAEKNIADRLAKALEANQGDLDAEPAAAEPVAAEPVAAEPVAAGAAPRTLTVEQEAAIRAALGDGFDPETLAAHLGVDLAVIQGLQ